MILLHSLTHQYQTESETGRDRETERERERDREREGERERNREREREIGGHAFGITRATSKRRYKKNRGSETKS